MLGRATFNLFNLDKFFKQKLQPGYSISFQKIYTLRYTPFSSYNIEEKLICVTKVGPQTDG